MDNLFVPSSTDPLEPADLDVTELALVAGLLDQVAAADSRFRRHMLASELILHGAEALNADDALAPSDRTASAGGSPGKAGGEQSISDTPGTDPDVNSDFVDEDEQAHDALSLIRRAAWYITNYHAKISGEAGSERVRMEPNFTGPDHTEPPTTETVDADIVRVWAQLAQLVQSPGASAPLRHLLFQIGSDNPKQHAELAVDAYLHLSLQEARFTDAAAASRTALRLARAIGDHDRRARSIARLAEVGTQATKSSSPSLGAAKEVIRALIREDPALAAQLIDQACDAWPGDAGDVFWHYKLMVTHDAGARRDVWERRVQTYIELAERSGSNIVRATRLRQALELAEQSGDGPLRERAAVLVQGIRHLDLEMMSISASSHQFEEQVEHVIATILNDIEAADQIGLAPAESDHGPVESAGGELPDASAWRRRLISFANFSPPTGDPDSNRELIAARQRLSVLASLFPKQLQTPEGLPLYAPATEEERFELEMVEWEVELLQQWTVFLSEALHRVIEHEMPEGGDLVLLLQTEPAATPQIASQLAGCFERYWSGDGQAAAYVAVPMIEALVRNAVLHADRGIFRLQRKQTPGQYVGLGALLDLFYESYDVSERDQRFFAAVLKHPGGWNLRNQLAHGYLPGLTGTVGAVALYTAVRVILLASVGPKTSAEGNPGEEP